MLIRAWHNYNKFYYSIGGRIFSICDATTTIRTFRNFEIPIILERNKNNYLTIYVLFITSLVNKNKLFKHC